MAYCQSSTKSLVSWQPFLLYIVFCRALVQRPQTIEDISEEYVGQTRLNSVAILNIERKYVNMSVGKNVDKVIDIFAARKGRKEYFF